MRKILVYRCPARSSHRRKQPPAPYGMKYPEPAYTAYEEGLRVQQELEERED